MNILKSIKGAGIALTVRNWLITKLAGKSMIVMNVNLVIQDRREEQYPIVYKDVKGSLNSSIEFVIPDGLEILFTQKSA